MDEDQTRIRPPFGKIFWGGLMTCRHAIYVTGAVLNSVSSTVAKFSYVLMEHDSKFIFSKGVLI